MISVVKVISTVIESKKRFVKFLRLGKSDVQNMADTAPFGIDGNPLKDMIAIYAQSGMTGKNYIIGYINKNQKAEPGELRLYSLSESGEEKAYQYFKKDGTIEILGTTDNLVRYAALNTALQAEVVKVNAELAKISVAIVALGGAYAVAPVTLDISAAKITEIKTTS